MRRPYTRLYVHLVWATWDRLPLIQGPVRDAVYRAIIAEAKRQGAVVGAVGGIEDHVHVLTRIPATVSVAELIQRIKGVSSHLIHEQVAPDGFFKWQGAYGAFTIAEADVPRVRRYIRRQEEHHRDGTVVATLEQIEDDDRAPGRR